MPTATDKEVSLCANGEMGIADLHLLILLPVVRAAKLAVNEALSEREWGLGTTKPRSGTASSSAASERAITIMDVEQERTTTDSKFARDWLAGLGKLLLKSNRVTVTRNTNVMEVTEVTAK